MASFDVVSLFTRVPVNHTITYIRKRLEDDRSWMKRSNYTLEELIEIIQICTQTTTFKFRDHKYQQENGLPMGSPLSPVLAEFCMQSLEENIVEGHPYIKSWIRFVDDVHAIIKSRKTNDILRCINSFHLSIQFTVEMEAEQVLMGDKKFGIPFLDVFLFKKDDETIGRCVYRKPTHTNRYLHFTSSHPTAHKISVVDSLVTRGLRICEKDDEATNKELSFIKSCLQKNGYPNGFVEKRIKIQKYKMSIRKPPANPDETEVFPKRVCLPYYPKVTEKMASYIRRNTDLELAYSPQNKISGHLSAHKDRKTLLDTGIYQWICEGSETESCSKVYIGETRKGLQTRSAQHMYHIYSGNINSSAVAEHVCNTGHRMDPDKITLIEREPNTVRRKVKEGLYIQHTANTMNKNNGYTINPAWAHTLKKNFCDHVAKKKILPP